MKAVRMILFCFACLLVFLVFGVATCTIRAKYRYFPDVRASLAYSYAAFFSEYAFLQSNQAGGEQGKTALLEYLGILQRFQNEKIKYPEKILHLYSELTYLRLYRLEVDTNNPAKADQYARWARAAEGARTERKEVGSGQLTIRWLRRRQYPQATAFVPLVGLNFCRSFFFALARVAVYLRSNRA